MQSIAKLDQAPSSAPDTSDIDGWVVVEGNPTMKTKALHTSKDGAMLSEIWEATPGTYYAPYSAYGFVHMPAGRIVITPDGGAPVTVQAGDAFVVENGYKGTWKIEEAVPNTLISSCSNWVLDPP